jgi:site-specific DNA recombinase
MADVPEWRIISEDLWKAVRARQASLDDNPSTRQASPFWTKQRPRYLFSGLMRCGVCGGGFSKISANHFGCSTARNKGSTACRNLLTIRRDELEQVTLESLCSRLMEPALFKIFAAAFTAEWNRLQADADGEQQAQRAELEHVRRQIERLVDAIAEGAPAAAVHGRLALLEDRRLRLDAVLSTALSPAPRLHPNLADLYRQRAAELTRVLAAENAAEARELVRSLVETITLVPDGRVLRIEVRGELAAILRMAQGAEGARGAGGNADALAMQIKRVAGARNHLCRTRFHALAGRQ